MRGEVKEVWNFSTMTLINPIKNVHWKIRSPGKIFHIKTRKMGVVITM